MGTPTVVFSGALVLALAAELPAQPRVRIPDAPSCPTCRIESTSVALLRGIPEAYGLATLPQNLVEAHRGELWLFDEQAPILVFDSTGSFLRTFGRTGSGPGEMRWPIDAWRLPGDSMLVLEPSLNNRATVFDGEGRAVRQITFSHRLHRGAVIEWPEAVLMSGALRMSGDAESPLHIVSFRGAEATITRSFGAVVGARSNGADYGTLVHPFSRGPHKQFVSAAPNMYDITRLGSLVMPALVLERRPAWFSDQSSMRFGSPETPPQPSLRFVSVDSLGRLWTVTHVPSPRWKQAWNGMQRSELEQRREVSVRSLNVEHFFDTQVEVLDLSRARVISSLRITGPSVALLPSGRLAVYQMGIAGEPQVRMLQLTLVRP